MCPLILSYLVFNSMGYQLIHVHGETKPDSQSVGNWRRVHDLCAGPVLIPAFGNLKHHHHERSNAISGE